MTGNRTAQLRTAQLWEKLAILIDTPEIKTFQWAVDGKSVVVNCRLFEEELSGCEKLSTLKRFRSADALLGFFYAHGFKKITQSSSADVHVLQHPDFSIKGLAARHKRKTVCLSSSVHGPQRGKPLRKPKRKKVLAASSPDLLFPPVKRRNARSLYQYINYIHPALQSKAPQDAPSSTAEASPSPALTHTDPELCGSTNTPK